MAFDCVAASLRVDGKKLLIIVIFRCRVFVAGLTPYDSESGGVTPFPSVVGTPKENRGRMTKLKPVSFDDYYTLWRGIATSIHGYKDPNDCEFLHVAAVQV